jgi:hypothetical protein
VVRGNKLVERRGDVAIYEAPHPEEFEVIIIRVAEERVLSGNVVPRSRSVSVGRSLGNIRLVAAPKTEYADRTARRTLLRGRKSLARYPSISTCAAAAYENLISLFGQHPKLWWKSRLCCELPCGTLRIPIVDFIPQSVPEDTADLQFTTTGQGASVSRAKRLGWLAHHAYLKYVS